jgi:Bacterial extracellular solute-binding protein/von Willebrand factor type A domain
MGRHTRPGRTGRPVTGVVALVGALFLGVVGTVTVVASRSDRAVSAPPPCPTTLRVVAAASYAPILDRIAPAVAEGSDCARLEVTVADGRGATTRVAELPADVWIPDDAGWAGTPAPAQLAEAPKAGAGTVLAVSPFYLVTDRDSAQRVRDAGGGWLGVANLVTNPPAGAEPLRLAARDPGGSGDGMLGLGAFAEAVWEESGMDASAEALAAALPVTRTVAGPEPALPRAPGEVGLVPEYALHAVQEQVQGPQSVVLAPGDHTAALRYSWFPTAAAVADPARTAALDRLLRTLTGPDADVPLVETGLRRPDAGPPPGLDDGMPAQTAPLFGVLGPHHVDHVLASWYTADRRADVLVAVDVSGSMGATVAGSDQKLIDLVRDGVGELASLLPDDSQMTLWKFGTALDGGRDHAVILDRTTLDAGGRAAIADAAEQLQAQETGTGLHDTILAAYEAARDAARPGVPRHVVVFTDGRNEADAVTLSIDQLRERLTAAKDPQRPVEVTVVAFGGLPDAAALEGAIEPVDGYLDRLRAADQVKAAFIHAAAGGVHE